MNIALIIAGGSGVRMGSAVPKQFINVYDKPVIIYTLEAFQRHPNIYGMMVSCLEGWHDILRAYAAQFGISKLMQVVPGGVNGQESIYNGLCALKERLHDNDIVLVHDAIRPLVSEEIISDSIRTCTVHGNAISCIPCTEAMLVTSDGECAAAQIDRSTLKRTQTPQTFRFGSLWQAHKRARELGITNSVASCTLMIELGIKVQFSVGSEKNIKLTTTDDIDIFKALLHSKRSEGSI